MFDIRKKTVFLVIPNHIFASDLLRTDYIKYLSNIYNIVIISPIIGSKEVDNLEYFNSNNILYIKRNLTHSKLWNIFKFLRITLVNKFDYLNYYKQFYLRDNFKKNKKRRLVRFLGKSFKKILTADFFTVLESFFMSIPKDMSDFFVRFNPSLIITATPGLNSFEAELIISAKKKNIPTVAIDFSWDNLTTNAKHIRKTDYLIAWNNIMKQEAISIHKYLPEKVFISGSMRFDSYFRNTETEPTQDEFLRSKGLNPSNKTIFYTTVTKAYPFQKQYLKELLHLRESGKIPYVNIFVRIHPRDEYDNYKEFFNYKDFYFEKAGHEIIDENGNKNIEMDQKDLLNLKYSLKYSDININYASTISIEACVFNKPIINIGYAGIYAMAYNFDHYKHVYKSGAVMLAKTESDLGDYINIYLEDQSKDFENRRKVFDSFFDFKDGLSYKRSVDFLDKIIK